MKTRSSVTTYPDGVPRTAKRVPHDEVAAIRADIERTRADLGDTVEALAGKVDVKARARHAAASAGARARRLTTSAQDLAGETLAAGERWVRSRPLLAAVSVGSAVLAVAAVGTWRFVASRGPSRRRFTAC